MNNEKNIITIITDTKEEKEAEIIDIVYMKDKGNYIIYKIDDEFYGARYETLENGTKIDAALTDEEKDLLNEVFERLVNSNA